MSGPLLTARDLAERWQVSADHVYRLARDGKIPFVQLGRYKRFRLDAIEAFEVGRDNDTLLRDVETAGRLIREGTLEDLAKFASRSAATEAAELAAQIRTRRTPGNGP